jgi:hypothetical protein
MNRRRLALMMATFVAIVGALMLTNAACSSAPQASLPPTQTPLKQSVSVPPAPSITSGRKEAVLVAAPRKRLEETILALQQGDIAGARESFDAYDSEWNGIEVYVNFRTRALYGEIESHYQAVINTALGAAQPNATEIIPQLQGMLGQYDEAIKLSDTGPPISPLFDDVATVRTVRAPLRKVSPALKGGDLIAATNSFNAFKSRWPEVQTLFSARSSDALRDTQAALDEADGALAVTPMNVADSARLVDALLDRYNLGVNLLSAAARNADLTKRSFSPEDVQAAARAYAIERELRTSFAAWGGGDSAAASIGATNAAGPRFEAVAAGLQGKGGADAPLKKALEAYVTAVTQSADPMQVRTAQRAAVDAVAVAQQVLVGQFWTDPAFQSAYQQARDTR